MGFGAKPRGRSSNRASGLAPRPAFEIDGRSTYPFGLAHGARIGGAYVVQVDQTWRTGLPAGLIVNYQDPENFGVIMLEPGALGGQAKVTYAVFKNGEKRRREAIAVR